jgi:hypothetical protein
LFSRYVVGWMIARHENAALAKVLIEDSVTKHGVEPGTLVLHSDRDVRVTSKTLAQLLAGLDVTRSLSCPYTSNDNLFSESQFKTLKYHPSFPGRFATLDDLLAWTRMFLPWKAVPGAGVALFAFSATGTLQRGATAHAPYRKSAVEIREGTYSGLRYCAATIKMKGARQSR